MIAYFNGRFMPKEDICIPADDRGFLFSDSLYEVIRYYPGHLFRPDAHIRHLNYGAGHLTLSCTDFSFLIPVVRDLIHQNHLEKAVFEDTVTTAPLSNYILGGITRDTLLDLCRNLGIRTSESPIYQTRVHLASELMVTGTTLEVTPVVFLDGRVVGDGSPGPTVRALQAAFTDRISF